MAGGWSRRIKRWSRFKRNSCWRRTTLCSHDIIPPFVVFPRNQGWIVLETKCLDVALFIIFGFTREGLTHCRKGKGLRWLTLVYWEGEEGAFITSKSHDLKVHRQLLGFEVWGNCSLLYQTLKVLASLMPSWEELVDEKTLHLCLLPQVAGVVCICVDWTQISGLGKHDRRMISK